MYSFSDVLIEPKYSEISSRKDVDLFVELAPHLKLNIPIISANMKTVTGADMAVEMIQNGGYGILHRFYRTTTDYIEAFKKTLDKTRGINITGVSIGVQQEDKNLFFKLYHEGARIFCIDVAHGHHILVKQMIQWIKDQHLPQLCIIAGNVATVGGYTDLIEWGADIVKVGVGPGSACRTRKNTGIGVPQLSALKEIYDVRFDENQTKIVPIIADGGLHAVGDIAKALVYADAVMVGSMIAGTSETPGKVYKDEKDQYYKFYAGSASGETKESNGQIVEYVEGISRTIPFRGSVKYILKEMKEGIQSACSYVGASNLKEFREKATFIEISDGGRRESNI